MKSDNRWLRGARFSADTNDFSEEIAFNDHKIVFVLKHCRDKDVLDLGCVQHNPENYKSRFWLHKALKSVARSLEGIDLYEPGVSYLNSIGFNVSLGDAQAINKDRKYDVIVAGDLIEHLEDFSGFFESCKKHLKQNGKLIISTPNPWYWRNIVKALLFSRVSNNPEHTTWFCPVTLEQLAARHDLKIVDIEFGSRYLRDRLLPLPRGIKHTSFHSVLRVV